jgi:ABC-2 type transport system permease protein
VKRWWSRYATATRFALIEQARNRLALAIFVFFIPGWLALAYKVAPPTPVPFFLRPVGHSITVRGTALAQITGGLHVIALLVGFMMFIATARSAPFDRRLVQAGYPRLTLVLAKLTALVLAAVAVAVYTTAWMQLYWRPQQFILLATSLFLGALIYGGIGVMLAAILRSDLAGMFLLIMISFIDLGLQNPVANPGAAGPILHFLPDHGAMQSAVTSVELRLVPWSYFALGLCWATGTAALGITAFALRTRSHRTTPPSTRPPETHEAIAVLADPTSPTQ